MTAVKRTLPLLLALLTVLSGLSACGKKEEAPTYDDGFSEGYVQGHTDGKTVSDLEVYNDGYDDGYNDGFADGQNSLDAQPGAAGTSKNELDSSGFVMVSDVIPDAIFEIRYFTSYNFVGDPITGYEEPVALLTKEAAAALKEVSDELLLQGYRLKIFDTYRPQMAVEHFKNWARDVEDTRMKEYFYPELDKSVLFVSGYIASRSGHSRGSTVDLTLFDMATGKEVDMGGAYDFFGDISHSARTEGLTAEQIENRAILKKAMEAHGFKSISTEWWHFQLKNEPYPSTYFNFPVKTLEG